MEKSYNSDIDLLVNFFLFFFFLYKIILYFFYISDILLDKLQNFS